MDNIFKYLIITGRPNAGKTGFTNLMRSMNLEDRCGRFHIGYFVELDDFDWLIDKFKDDDVWESVGYPRLYSRRVEGGYVQTEDSALLDFLIAKFNFEVNREFLVGYEDYTIFLEFARGRADGGIRRALELMEDEILKNAAVLYLDVSIETSLRRNAVRAYPLPHESFERFSVDLDWDQLSGNQLYGNLDIRGYQVPFVRVDNNSDEMSFDERLVYFERWMSHLYELYAKRKGQN